MKILVIGAGPAGLSTAINAGRGGCEVLVFEKNDRLGIKPCGEALPREALDFIGIEPSKEFIVNEAKSFRVSYKGKFMREASFAGRVTSPGYVIDKPLLLEVMRKKAEDNGAKIMFNSRVEMVDPSAGKIKLEDDTILQGDLIVCADGLGSIARSHLDYSAYDIATCLQCYCILPSNIEQEHLYLDIIGEGFAWAFPKKGCMNVGIGLPKSSNSVGLLKELLDRHMERLGTKPIDKIRGAQVSIGGPLSSFGIGKLTVVGEAAGCVMPLSGEGVRFGIYGGSIVHQPDYRKKFMNKYGNKMKNSRKMLLAIEMLSDEERVDLLERLEDPLKTLEGELPSITSFMDKPKLLMKLMQIYIA